MIEGGGRKKIKTEGRGRGQVEIMSWRGGASLLVAWLSALEVGTGGTRVVRKSSHPVLL
jgi:hypothetical protein